MSTKYDETLCEWYVEDINGIPHYGDTPRDARESAAEANRIISDHRSKCPADSF